MSKKVSKFNKNKFRQVLHYIIEKVGSYENIGKTVIWKILYFSDFDYYEEYEEFLTGEEYHKFPMGPAPSHFSLAISELKKNGCIKVIRGKFCGFPQLKFISQMTANKSLLSATEIKVIDRTIAKLSNMTARQISSYSHLDMPWKATKDKETIDYELVFYRDETMSVRESEEDDYVRQNSC